MIIADNEYYKLEVKPSKNRVYIAIYGFWPNISIVPNYLNDWEKSLTLVSSGFTILADVREMKIHPKEVTELHSKTIEMTTAKGYSKTAEVINEGIAKMQIDRIYKENVVRKNLFNTVESAEEFLNTKVSALPYLELV